MEREPVMGRHDASDAVKGHEADPAWIASLPSCPGLPSTHDEIAASVARARGQMLAGRGIPGEDVARWAAALGTADEKPMPSEWLA